MTKNLRKMNLLFFNFFAVFRFFSALDYFLDLYGMPFNCEQLDSLLAEGKFSLNVSAFVVSKILLTFPSFLVQVVCKCLFF